MEVASIAARDRPQEATFHEDHSSIGCRACHRCRHAAAIRRCKRSSAIADEEKGKCIGANACKGQSACATGSNSCHATNACKGQGWLEMSKSECEKIEGAKFEPASK